MTPAADFITETYGHRLRVRVCGLCIQNGRVLMVRHRGLSRKGYFWAPPGGGLQFGEPVAAGLQREFAEETGLQIETDQFLFVHEFIHLPLHALELFFSVKVKSGQLQPGHDPETGSEQIIETVKFMSYEEINQEKGVQLHDVFNQCSSINELLQRRGYFKSDNKARY